MTSRTILAAALCALAAGCGGGRASHDSAAAFAAPAPAAECGNADGAHVRPFWLHASDGQRLYAFSGGSGSTGVVLVPESPPGNVCNWLPFVATLGRARLRVLAVDYRGTGDSPVGKGRDPHAYERDLDAAVGQLRAEGAGKVILAGASLGGAMAMAFAPSLDVDGVISLSGETGLPDYRVNALGALPRLRVPLLIVGTRHDVYLPIADARRLLRRAGADDKMLVLFPGSRHGWEILEDAPFAHRARNRILEWIRARSFR